MNNATEHIYLLNPASVQSSELEQRMSALAPPPSEVNLENVKDFSHVCRICATITKCVTPIYAGEGLQNDLADKIKQYLPIQVSKSDELPLVVCDQCSSTLLAFHELVMCCKQADVALHAKLRLNQRKLNGALNTKEEDGESLALPEYRACVYCPRSQPAHSYQQHMVLVHGHLLFLCEACDLLMDRKDFMVHMAYHTQGKVKKKEASSQPRRPPAAPAPPAPAPAPQVEHKTETKPLIVKSEAKEPAVTAKTKMNVQVNEFSDHSDMDEFGPLPESVFEAIEDTQDSQHLEDNTGQTPDKTSRSENTNSSNLSQCLENNNSVTNNCSVVLEPIDINNYGQRTNAVIKNTSSPPAAKTAPNTADSQPTVLGKRNRNKLRKCPLCPKEYEASSSYFYHLKHTHKGSKEHECEVCGRKFGTRSCLAQHMAVHTGQYEFECKQCQKQFRSKAGLYIHEQTHGGSKAWACGQCPAAFRWQAQLRRHAARHAGERAHACAACGRAFSVRADLLRHARTHAAGCFACDKCGQKFAQQRYLAVHVAKQHNTKVKKSK